MSVCRKCGVALVVGENWYPSYARRSARICKGCRNAYKRKRRSRPAVKQAIKVSRRARTTHRRAIVARYKRMKGCAVCGYQGLALLLHAPHYHDVCVSQMVSGHAWAETKKEALRCVVLCYLCHRTVHRLLRLSSESRERLYHLVGINQNPRRLDGG